MTLQSKSDRFGSDEPRLIVECRRSLHFSDTLAYAVSDAAVALHRFAARPGRRSMNLKVLSERRGSRREWGLYALHADTAIDTQFGVCIEHITSHCEHGNRAGLIFDQQIRLLKARVGAVIFMRTGALSVSGELRQATSFPTQHGR